MTATTYPLSWPTGWPRRPSHQRTRANFGTVQRRAGQAWASKGALSLTEAKTRLIRELERLGAINEVLSTNLHVRLDGWPKAGQPAPSDPGAAIYFDLMGKPTVLACDRWDRVEDNIAALAKHIEAMRGMDRWGVGSLEQAFTGYQALPAPDPWWKVLGLAGPTNDSKQVGDAYRRASSAAHPDRPGGSHDKMAAVNAARDEGLRLIGQS